MTLARCLQIAAAAALLLGAAKTVWDYEAVHKPAFQLIQAEVLYEKCMRECRQVCAQNSVPPQVCKCEHCRKYLGGG